jgi:radical SAM-linked protein
MGYTVSITFTKKGESRYISHLDLLRLFGRALRRAGVPFEVSNGFSKHPMISIKRALKLGVESENEEAKFILSKEMPDEEFKQRMQRQLPEGILFKCQTKF